ncbi:hypothetical protein G9C98_007341 [Cotesia typhae]|uniref:Uncharacterized protein n=1 Tax=Cotesia typhae TaxID=2053667 RepID=A0A8J5RFI9_9HYME|nr:hypothetical protein G9C98_007341 [Cotesia typhae]
MLHDTRSEMNFKLKTLRHRDHDFSKIELVKLEEKVLSVWNLLTTMLFKYLKDNHDRHIRYENQAEKNKKNQKIFFEHTTQITHLLGFITTFQRKIVELYHQSNDQVFKFTSTKDLLLNKYSSMAKQYKKGISFRKY